MVKWAPTLPPAQLQTVQCLSVFLFFCVLKNNVILLFTSFSHGNPFSKVFVVFYSVHLVKLQHADLFQKLNYSGDDWVMSCWFFIFYLGLQSEASAIFSAMLLSLHSVYSLNISFFTLLFHIFSCLSHTEELREIFNSLPPACAVS